MASRMALMAYACDRSTSEASSYPSVGHTPKSVWYKNISSLRSGTCWPDTCVLLLALSFDHRSRRSFHWPGISESTLMRARTSSARLVSWVVVAFMEFGQCLRRSAMKREELSATAAEGRGSPPTSFTDMSGLYT